MRAQGGGGDVSYEGMGQRGGDGGGEEGIWGCAAVQTQPTMAGELKVNTVVAVSFRRGGREGGQRGGTYWDMQQYRHSQPWQVSLGLLLL